ncbi:MAG: hypothetical protein AMXMBFR33_27260 [Candidatus Xenobia bacterium]
MESIDRHRDEDRAQHQWKTPTSSRKLKVLYCRSAKGIVNPLGVRYDSTTGLQYMIPSWGPGRGLKGALTENELAENPYILDTIPGAMYSSTTFCVPPCISPWHQVNTSIILEQSWVQWQ